PTRAPPTLHSFPTRRSSDLYTRFLKLEGSWFNGREPDDERWDFDFGSLDSWSGRLSLEPSRNWVFQVSYGHLAHPEALEPGSVEDRKSTRLNSSHRTISYAV